MQVQCPCCQKTLSAPKEMLSKQVECPYCSVRFHVTSGDGGASVSVSMAPLAQTAAPPTPPPAAAPPAVALPTAFPPTAVSATPSGPVGAPARFKPLGDPQNVAPGVAVNLPPVASSAAPLSSTAENSTETSVPITPLASFKSARPKRASPKTARSRKATNKAVAPALPPSVSSSGLTSPTASSTQKTVKQATFIAADATQSRVHLGADGQLPQLVLEKNLSIKTKEEKPKKSSPLVMIGVLCLSFGFSVLMLFMDTSSGPGEAPSKAQTRRLLEQSYIAQDPPLEAYQLLLRKALQFHTRGDTDQEQRLYRRVLDMLHSEGKNKFKGLTGVPDADRPPNDRDLETLLSTMLAEDN